MYRREFLKAASAFPAAAGFTTAFADKTARVGLIGSGWYGKCDLFRLIQVAPVEVVSICDVDSRMLSEAADLISVRQASHKKPRTYSDYREMLKQRDLDIVLIGTPDHWHALQMIAAVGHEFDGWQVVVLACDVVLKVERPEKLRRELDAVGIAKDGPE